MQTARYSSSGDRRAAGGCPWLVRSEVITGSRCRDGVVEADRAEGGVARLAGPRCPPDSIGRRYWMSWSPRTAGTTTDEWLPSRRRLLPTAPGGSARGSTSSTDRRTRPDVPREPRRRKKDSRRRRPTPAIARIQGIRFWERDGSGGPSSGAVRRCHQHWHAVVDLRRRAGPAGLSARVPSSGRSAKASAASASSS